MLQLNVPKLIAAEGAIKRLGLATTPVPGVERLGKLVQSLRTTGAATPEDLSEAKAALSRVVSRLPEGDDLVALYPGKGDAAQTAKVLEADVGIIRAALVAVE